MGIWVAAAGIHSARKDSKAVAKSKEVPRAASRSVHLGVVTPGGASELRSAGLRPGEPVPAGFQTPCRGPALRQPGDARLADRRHTFAFLLGNLESTISYHDMFKRRITCFSFTFTDEYQTEVVANVTPKGEVTLCKQRTE
jgi:hypothetical protein